MSTNKSFLKEVVAYLDAAFPEAKGMQTTRGCDAQTVELVGYLFAGDSASGRRRLDELKAMHAAGKESRHVAAARSQCEGRALNRWIEENKGKPAQQAPASSAPAARKLGADPMRSRR